METIQNILTGIVVLDAFLFLVFFTWGLLKILIYLHDRRFNGRH